MCGFGVFLAAKDDGGKKNRSATSGMDARTVCMAITEIIHNPCDSASIFVIFLAIRQIHVLAFVLIEIELTTLICQLYRFCRRGRIHAAKGFWH
jgi:hypothetical protein